MPGAPAAARRPHRPAPRQPPTPPAARRRALAAQVEACVRGSPRCLVSRRTPTACLSTTMLVAQAVSRAAAPTVSTTTTTIARTFRKVVSPNSRLPAVLFRRALARARRLLADLPLALRAPAAPSLGASRPFAHRTSTALLISNAILLTEACAPHSATPFRPHAPKAPRLNPTAFATRAIAYLCSPALEASAARQKLWHGVHVPPSPLPAPRLAL